MAKPAATKSPPIAGVRGATAGLMAEVVEDHVRTHLVDAE
jgi:DNA-binding FrmR family transcriptional regulator